MMADGDIIKLAAVQTVLPFCTSGAVCQGLGIQKDKLYFSGLEEKY